MSVLACQNPMSSLSYLPLADSIHPFVNERTTFPYHVAPTYHRAASVESGLSLISIVKATKIQDENVNRSVPQARAASLSTLDTLADGENMSIRRKSSMRITHKSSWRTEVPCPPKPTTAIATIDVDSMEDIDLNAQCGLSDLFSTADTEVTAGRHNKQRLSFAVDNGSLDLDLRQHDPFYNEPSNEDKPHPFQKWIQSLHKKSMKRIDTLQPRFNRHSVEDTDDVPGNDGEMSGKSSSRRHRKSSSWSSSGFVTAVKSTTASLAGFSAGAISRGTSRRTRRSTLVKSIRSGKVNRESTDDSIDTQIMDEASNERAVQRRRTIGELVSSEESYIADLKALANV